MPIYFDFNYNQLIFTDNGDIFYPGNSYGFFGDYYIERDLNGNIISDTIHREVDGNIIPESRIKHNIRPTRFTGITYGPPYSPHNKPDIIMANLNTNTSINTSKISKVLKPLKKIGNTIIKSTKKINSNIINLFKK